MENNEIYIDGVDVAGCPDIKQYNDTEGNMMCMEYIDGSCEGHNCFFKQLKQAENTVNECHKYLAELEDKIDCLEQENRELKAYKDINEGFKQAWDELNEKYKQLRSALEEIMESAKFAQCLPCGSGNLEDCLNCDDETTNNGQFCMEKRIYEIKTKCVEVLTP